jgi:hypothetical protein
MLRRSLPVLCFTLPFAAYAADALCTAQTRTGAAAAPKQPALKVESYRGKVVSLTERLKQHGIRVDPEASLQLGLEADDGKVYPLVHDGGSLMFYRDAKLLGRPLQVQGRLIPNTGLLQLTQVFSLKDGKPHEVFYWCDVCAIKRFSLEKTGVCECCGGKMELREVPVAK